MSVRSTAGIPVLQVTGSTRRHCSEHARDSRQAADSAAVQHLFDAHPPRWLAGGGDPIGPPPSTATGAARNGAAVTAATLAPVAETVVAALAQTSTVAGDLVTRTTEVVTPLVQAAAGSGRALSDGLAAQVKTVAGLTVDVYQQAVRRQLDLSIVLADAVPVGWVGELTRRNAAVIGELVAVYVGVSSFT